MTPKEYIQRFSKLIKSRLKHSPLLPSVVLAHALYEASDDEGYIGKSLLALEYNNDVRVKANKSWKGPKILAPLRKATADAKPRKAWYRIYPSSEQAISDRIDMLLTRVKSWPKALLHDDTVRIQATILQMTVVSDDPRYSERIVKLVDKHQLYWYDWQWIIERAIKGVLFFGAIRLGMFALGFWDVWFHGK